MEVELKRPQITEYQDPALYMSEMLRYRKLTEPAFSVLSVCGKLRKVSPSLVSLVVKGKRRITYDRIDQFSKLLNLSTSEKFYFKNWIQNIETIDDDSSFNNKSLAPVQKRKNVSLNLLSDWLNVYVKDLFQLKTIQANPKLIYKDLAHIASAKRIDKSINFLLKEAYLRKTLDQKIVVDTPLAVADQKIPSAKIRAFHKGALNLARTAIDLYSPQQRLANALSIPLNEKSYQELLGIIDEFSEKLKEFAENNNDEGDCLYQLLINLSPIGGKAK